MLTVHLWCRLHFHRETKLLGSQGPPLPSGPASRLSEWAMEWGVPLLGWDQQGHWKPSVVEGVPHSLPVEGF